MNSAGDKSRLSVLYVDDEEKSLKYFDRAISKDFRVITTTSVSAAEKILIDQSENIAVLISDQRMPEDSGVRFLQKARKIHPHAIRMLTTAYSDLQDTINAVNDVGIYRYINKPWNLDHLAETIDSAMKLFVKERKIRDLVNERKKSMLTLACSIGHELRVSLLKIGAVSWTVDNSLPALLSVYDKSDKIPYIGRDKIDDLKHTVHDISQEVNRSNAIIDMLLMNAAENNNQAFLADINSIVTVVHGTLNSYPFNHAQRSLVQCELTEEFSFYGTVQLIQHVLFNLINNSLYAINQLGKGDISIRLEKAADYNKLVFRDTGGGIAAEDIPYIFDDFFSSKTSYTNAGLGLAF
ncbi:MAG: hybrid sensor histidine kinase/response regulator, partial [Gammaproteobacteria bacterium]|nr:hybrid sensor histidine kinase/response regulator [Gammaproteobacteria bacterium]